MLTEIFTPKLPAPLGLDLTELSGGGSSPAQFWGKTHDARAVYGRYRGGGLSVEIAETSEDEADHLLMDVRLGPYLHGDLSLGQLRHYAGITIDGKAPALPDFAEQAEGYHDLSGAASFLTAKRDCSAERVTSILRVLQQKLPHARFVEFEFNDDHQIERLNLLPTTDLPQQWHSLLVAGAKDISKRLNAWQPGLPYLAALGDALTVTARHERPETQSIPIRGIWLSANFATDNADHHYLCEQIIQIVKEA